MLLPLVCVRVSSMSSSAQRQHTHTHSSLGPRTGRQLNRSAWGNLCQPVGGGRQAAGGSRTGENSNTSDRLALCFTCTEGHTHSHIPHTRTTPCIYPAGEKDDKEVIEWRIRTNFWTVTSTLNLWNYTKTLWNDRKVKKCPLILPFFPHKVNSYCK